MHERTLGLGMVLGQLARTPHPAAPSVDWEAFNDELDTSPHPAALDPVIRGAAAALKAIKDGIFHEEHEADLIHCLNVPEAAPVMSDAVTHVLPGEVSLFLQLRSVLSQRFRAPLGGRVLG